MATPLVLTGCRVFAGGYDLTADSNKVEVSAQFEEKDVTTFLPTTDPNVGWKKVLGGLGSAKIVGGGNWGAASNGSIDDFALGALGTTTPHSVYATDANEGSLGYFTNTLVKNYQFFGSVGDVASWTLDDESAWPLVRGQSLEAPGTARTATGSGTAVQIGAVPAGKSMYAALHVLSVSGSGSPTLTVRIQSDTVGFPSPVTQLTFTAATAIGGQILRTTPGAITDDYWRVDFTISGSSPSFLFVVTAGISV